MRKKRLSDPMRTTWHNMKRRCYVSTFTCFDSYGGRGIRVCDRWLESFDDFVADMGERPSRLHSIDRIDVDGDYEPANCRWATNEEQQANRRDSLKLEWNGETLSPNAIAEMTGIAVNTIRHRIKRGFPPEMVMSKEPLLWTRPAPANKDRHLEKCRAGHSMAGDNAYYAPDGIRHCRLCKKLTDKARYERKKGGFQ